MSLPGGCQGVNIVSGANRLPSMHGSVLCSRLPSYFYRYELTEPHVNQIFLSTTQPFIIAHIVKLPICFNVESIRSIFLICVGIIKK
jgi:hypothetical protein